MKLLHLLAVVLLSLFTSNAYAATLGFKTVHTAVPETDLVGGWIANDLLINFEGPLTGQQIIVELDSGSIFQSSLGGDTAPSAAFLDLPNFEALRWDSYVTIGGLDSTSSESVLVPGAAVDIQSGAREAKFDETGIDVAWAPNTGVIVDGGTDYPIARITLSPDASGTVWIFSSAGDGSGGAFTGQFHFTNGCFACNGIPEPTSSALASFAALGIAAFRRR